MSDQKIFWLNTIGVLLFATGTGMNNEVVWIIGLILVAVAMFNLETRNR